jgi:hypothetical protein
MYTTNSVIKEIKNSIKKHGSEYLNDNLSGFSKWPNGFAEIIFECDTDTSEEPFRATMTVYLINEYKDKDEDDYDEVRFVKFGFLWDECDDDNIESAEARMEFHGKLVKLAKELQNMFSEPVKC